jgi:hypothetical protein
VLLDILGGIDPVLSLARSLVDSAAGPFAHEQVRPSPEASKRTFLVNKGLTADEIAEAFRLVPEPAAPGIPSAVLHTTAQHLAPATPSQQPPQHLQALYPQQPEQRPVRWTHAFLGAGFAATGAYAAKSLIWPYLHDAYRSWRGSAVARGGEGAISEEAISVAAISEEVCTDAAAAKAVAEAIAAQTAELRTSIESISGLVKDLEARRPEPPGGVTIADLRKELGSFATTVSE